MLAIVIPYYKITFFEATLQSLANQTDKRFKVYIGDDASMENPANLLKKYEGRFDFVYHKFEENLGGISLTKQWERCIALTQNEEWLMILGDDDVLGETVVASWYNNYELFNKKSKVVRFASILIYEDVKSTSIIFNHPVWESPEDSFYRKFRNWTRSSLSEYIFCKASYMKFGFQDYPLAWNSDDRAWFDFSDNQPIYSINESIVSIRVSKLNISGKNDNVPLKNLSVMAFYKFILSNKLKFYNKEQRLRLIRRYKSEIEKNRKLNLTDWLFLLFFYLKYFDKGWFIKGWRKIFNKTINII